MIPHPWVAAVLVLAVHRLVRLAGWDTFRPLVWLRNWATGARPVSAGSTNARMGLTSEPVEVTWRYRWPTLAEGLACAYCASMWWGTAVYVAWKFEPWWTVTVCAPLALSTAVGVFSRFLDP